MIATPSGFGALYFGDYGICKKIHKTTCSRCHSNHAKVGEKDTFVFFSKLMQKDYFLD